VLITMVVISIGLLGMAGLHFAGLRAAGYAQQQTLASLLAQDIEASMR
jgi:Tfp pilus assembly protein PilV